MKNVTLKALALIAAIGLAGCSGGGGSSGGLTTAPSITVPDDGGTTPPDDGGTTPPDDDGGDTTPTPDEFVVPAAVPQISFSQVSSSTLYARSADAIPLDFTLSNPTGETPKCNWYMEVLPDAGIGFGGIAKAQFGTVGGPCDPFVHNQTNQLNYRYWVYISAGNSTLEYQWDVEYVSSAVNTAVSISSATAAGTYRVYDSKQFTVVVDDKDQDGTCSWKVDGVEVSTSCVSYTISAASGTRTLSFAIADGSTNDSRSWTIKPAAKITAFTPASANIANGASQAFVATLSDTNSSGATCEFKKDNVVVQSGSCTYNYTGDGAMHTITVEAIYGAEHSGTLSTAYAYGPANNPVSFTQFYPSHTSSMYFAPGETSNLFGVDFTDVDGDATFKWYLNGVEVDCDVSSSCTYTNPLKNGIKLDNFAGSSVVVKVVLSDGQYSASKTWLAHIDRVEINESLSAGTKCNASGAEFWIYGRGFESSDVITLQNQNVVLTKLYTSDNAVKVKLPQSVSPGMQKIRVVKSYNANQTLSGNTSSTVDTAFGFVTFTNSSSYCQ